MCVHLRLSHIKFAANRLAWSMNEILRVLKLNLFDRRPILEVLEPTSDPPTRRPARRSKPGRSRVFGRVNPGGLRDTPKVSQVTRTTPRPRNDASCPSEPFLGGSRAPVADVAQEFVLLLDARDDPPERVETKGQGRQQEEYQELAKLLRKGHEVDPARHVQRCYTRTPCHYHYTTTVPRRLVDFRVT